MTRPRKRTATRNSRPSHRALLADRDDSNLWFVGPPKVEARALLALVGRNGDTVDTIRELIRVPPRIEMALRTYGQGHAGEGMVQILTFRKRVAEEFARLVGGMAFAPSNPDGNSTVTETR